MMANKKWLADARQILIDIERIYEDYYPKSCYRAELTADLRKRIDLLWLPMSFAHFKGTDECPKYQKESKDNGR